MLLDSLPAPLQLGIIGFLLVTIAFILRRQNQLIQSGKLVPSPLVDKMIAEKDKLIAGQAIAIGEWREAHRISEQARAEERASNEASLEALGLSAYFFEHVAPKRDIPAQSGDNAPVGGADS